MMSSITQIPLAGNAYITTQGLNSTEVITRLGLDNWTQLDTICSIYFHLSVPGEFNLGFRLKVPAGESEIEIKVGENPVKRIRVGDGNVSDQIVTVGKFKSTVVGYVRVDLQGILRSGDYFAQVYDVILFGLSGKAYFVPDDFYFGRRGPSVHLRYDSTITQSSEYFYNEITVPEGQDIIGAYYAAIGFSEGYFGIQVNGNTERRVLFSIWSEFNTDDPSQIPEEYKVVLLKAGLGVIVQDFGNEGSGKQSFLRFNWKSNLTYKFLVHGIPIDKDNSKFTAWYYDPETAIWNLIASFMKPKKSTYVKSVYSFSENFIPENGWIQRKAEFGNPWVRDNSGIWQEITSCTFTGDATSKKSRLDFACGVENGEFFLRNCGFLNDSVQTDQVLIRELKNNVPIVDIPNLP